MNFSTNMPIVKRRKKVIGVIGGIGPEASANLYLKMIHQMQERYNAYKDSDYPPMIIYNLSMEGFDETGIVDEKKVKEQLLNASKSLEAAGAEVIIIACNTVHLYASYIEDRINIPLLNIVSATIDAAKNEDMKKLGVLCSQSTNELNVYDNIADIKGINLIKPNELQQNELNRVIESVMAGKHGHHEIIVCKNIMRKMAENGAEGILLGCTEIPLAINQVHTDIKLFDSLELIIAGAIEFSLSELT